jgi:hypothetical protein
VLYCKGGTFWRYEDNTTRLLLHGDPDKRNLQLLIEFLRTSHMFQIFNMPQDSNPSDAFCFDCIYRHEYIITQCSHTICRTCLYEAIDEKIRCQRKMFICPRCTDSEERRNRLGQSLVQRSNEGQPIVISISAHHHYYRCSCFDS